MEKLELMQLELAEYYQLKMMFIFSFLIQSQILLTACDSKNTNAA